jgi:SAM-dependent methyltransferase
VEPTDENLRAWEKAHTPAPRPEERLPEQVRGSLSDLAGKRVLHVNCGSGGVSGEFAALGASVTAVDASERTIHAARQRASSVLFIAAEPHALPAELQRGRFDLVYAGAGTVQATRDLDLFAANVAAALRPGADLLLFDEHPAALCVDGLLHWRDDYFGPEFHRLGQVVGAVARHHLSVRALEEYPAAPGTHRDARVPGTFLLHARKNR